MILPLLLHVLFNCFQLLLPSPGCSCVSANIPIIFTYIYVRPYKYTTQNVIEAVVLFDYCLLFILRSPLSLQELLNPYSGTSIPSHFGTELPPNDSITYFFWPFFYLPVFMGIGVCIAWIIYRVW